MLSEEARETDVVGRLGGDEFAMVLHDAGEEDALAAATRLGAALHAEHGPAPVTASLGVSTWLGDDDGPDALLRRADEALYAAKRAGRDQVAIWEAPETESQAGLQWLGRRPRRRVGRSGPDLSVTTWTLSPPASSRSGFLLAPGRRRAENVVWKRNEATGWPSRRGHSSVSPKTSVAPSSASGANTRPHAGDCSPSSR